MKICIMSFDAGPSEIIAAWADRQTRANFILLLGGPAKRVFARRFPDEPQLEISEFERILRDQKPDRLITGSSWGIKVERIAWKVCTKLKIPSVGVFEGWGDFRNAINLDGERVLPNEVWVFNSVAEQVMTKLGVPQERIKLQENFYFKDISDQVRTLEQKLQITDTKRRLLYVCENISSCESVYEIRGEVLRGYDELDALRLFFEKVLNGEFGDNLNIRIRPHPSETHEKYLPITQEFEAIKAEFSRPGETLEHDLAWSQVVVGCESAAMALAVECKKKVVSCIPAKAKIGCRLPYSEISRV